MDHPLSYDDSDDGTGPSHTPLASPRPRFLSSASALNDTPPDSFLTTDASNPNVSAPFLTAEQRNEYADDRRPLESSFDADRSAAAYNEKSSSSRVSRPRRTYLWRWLSALAVLIIIAAAVVLPVYFLVIKPKHDQNSSSGSGAGDVPGVGDGGPTGPTGLPTSGANGSTVTTENGTTFTYINNFGGYWVYNPDDPFNDDARPNSWTPPLNTSWTWGQDRVYGVNLGGLFVLEPFISPALFQKYQNLSVPVIDEWTLSEAMTNDTSPGGGLGQIEDHYNTFITEEDIAQIAGAGLNWVRIPIPYWAIETWEGEPFLAKTSWTYILRVLGWCRKYGLRVNLDLHTIPGSQNGFNHSGKDGQVDFLNGVMGIANTERAWMYIRIITEFISQPEYANLIPQFGVLNEPLLTTIGRDQLSRFYLQTHDLVRNITGYGEGNGPYISIHDGFQSVASWAGFLPGADRVILDTHPYFAFDNQPNTEPVDTWGAAACNAWGPEINASQLAFGITTAGEFSVGYNDCGMWLNGVGQGASAYGGNCSDWTDASQWNDTVKAGVMNYALASMDALQNWFFWTWKIGAPSNTSVVQAPLWSYSLGLEMGYIPMDPRTAEGTCVGLGVPSVPFNGTYESWMTGGASAGTIEATAVASFSQWPPPTVSPTFVGDAQVALLPTYTSTGTVATLAPPTLTVAVSGGKKGAVSTVSAGDGWFNTADVGAGVTTVAGCTYPDAWDAVAATLPSALCTGPTEVARRRLGY